MRKNKICAYSVPKIDKEEGWYCYNCRAIITQLKPENLRFCPICGMKVEKREIRGGVATPYTP